jgi:Holliday junction resolvasome RuvABC endonuclease subunit
MGALVIIGFDISLSTGWAVIDPNGVHLVEYGVIGFKRGKLVAAADKVRKVMDKHSLDVVAVEAVGFASNVMAHASYWRWRTVIEMVAMERDLYPVAQVHTSTLKKWATGSGRAKKDAMCKAARKRFGVQLWAKSEGGNKAQEDQADAIHVAAWAAD